MKKLILNLSLFFIVTLFISCSGNKEESTSTSDTNEAASTETPAPKTDEYDPKRGEGKFTAESLKIDATIDDAKAEAGQKIQSVKCSSCHKLSTEKLVGPGWKGITTRRAPEWIMNFITNPDPMINKDPELQAQLELCLVRMPNQGLTDDDARNILEFMRKNDK